MKKITLVVLILITPFSLLQLNSTLADYPTSCVSHSICVHPGNYLKYRIIAGNITGSETYMFGNMTGHGIRIIEQHYLDTKMTENVTFILDLRTGYGHTEQDNTTIPFLVALPVPIKYNQSDISVFQQLTNFNGFNRTALVATRTSNASSLLMEYDIQTGVLLSAHSIVLTKIFEKPVVLALSNYLVDTNIINSDSLQNKVVIPAWIKNTAGWWADGAIDDTNFVKAIQYLVFKGIIQIPHGSSGNSSSQEIPRWVKINAGWWSQGKIYDDDFISGIQYLINSGIVKV